MELNFMLNMTKEDSLRNYLGKERIQNLKKLYILVQENNLEIDDKAYNNMLEILNKYSSAKKNYFYTYFITKNILEKYCDLSYNVISKITILKNVELYKMLDFINEYTKFNLDFKISIVDEFSKIGIIEERALFKPISSDLYKKLLQIFSIKYKKGYTKESRDLYEQSKLSTIQKKSKYITKTIISYNKNSYLVNQEHFIKPTNSVLEIMCSLSDIIVDNEDDFKKFIDYLYKLFWENNVKNYAKNKELDFINNIRRYYYHDLEHGKNTDVKKKFKHVKDFYIESINKSIPKTAKDWQNIQEHIYDLLIEFLEKIEIK